MKDLSKPIPIESPWALFDLSYLAHRARHSMGNLSFEGESTQIIFGILESLRTICFDNRVKTNSVVICVDSKESFRRDFFPEYKLKRYESRSPEEIADIEAMHSQANILKKMLKESGFKVIKQRGLESDDIMAQAARQLQNKRHTGVTAIMVTADSDLLQCVTTDTVRWFDPQRDLFWGHLDVWAAKGVDPCDWAKVKAIGGCRGDNVPGVPGVGEKTAVDYLTKSLPASHKRSCAITDPSGQAIIARNRRLVRLPHKKTKEIDLSLPKYDPGTFFAWCKKLGFESYLHDRRRAWENFFAGRMNEFRQTVRVRGKQ